MDRRPNIGYYGGQGGNQYEDVGTSGDESDDNNEVPVPTTLSKKRQADVAFTNVDAESDSDDDFALRLVAHPDSSSIGNPFDFPGVSDRAPPAPPLELAPPSPTCAKKVHQSEFQRSKRARIEHEVEFPASSQTYKKSVQTTAKTPKTLEVSSGK